MLFVPILHEHGGVLLFGHRQILFRLVKTHHVGLDAVGGVVVVGVAMERDEEVGMVVVRDFGAVVEFHEDIGATGIYHLDIRAVFADELAGFQRDVKRHVFLAGVRSEASGILPAVSRVNHHLEGFAVFLGIHGHCEKSYEQTHEEKKFRVHPFRFFDYLCCFFFCAKLKLLT